MADNIESLYEEANNYYYENDYEKAAKLYQEIIKKNPNHYLSYEKLGKIEQARNNIKEAVVYFEKALNINNKNANGWNDLGNLYYDLVDYNNAIRCYKKAIEADSNFYWAYYNIGLSMTRMYTKENKKEMDEAKEWFEKALNIKKDYYPAFNELGLYYMDQNNYNKAEEYFTKCININPNYKYPYYNLASIYKERDDYKKAKEYLLKSLKCDPNYISALNNLGILYYDQEDYNSALYYYTRALEIDSKYKYALYNIGLVFYQMEKYRKAYEMYQKALESDPNYQVALDEKKELEKKYSKEIKKMEPIKEEDLKSETYKDKAEILDPEAVNLISANINNTQSIEVTETKEELYCEKFGRNLTKMAREGKLFEVIGRDSEIRSMLEVLYKIKKNNPLLIGKAGVGKTAVVEGLALKIANGDVPEFFKNIEIVEINMGMIVAGTTYRGDFEKRLQKIIDEVKEKENLIIFIDEIHTVLGAGETTDSSLDAANILKPALARGELRCIGATTIDEYQKYFQKDPAFDRRFYTIMVDELSPEATLEILRRLKKKMVEHYKIDISDENLQLIINLSKEEIKTRVFPDKAIDILEKTFSRCALDGKKEVDDITIKNIVGEFVGIKFLETEEDKGRHLLEMEKFLKERIFGQDEAIERIANIIRMTKNKLDLKPEQPDGVFFFVGSTGVGKTYLAKLIAEFLFGTQDKLITLNMAEFTEPHSVSKLIGAPPGYIGYDSPSFFSVKILENPSSVLLLDEIEKAHPEVLKIFLQIFDEGKITDTKGKTIFFSNVTIIMTSNAITSSSGNLGFGANEKIKTDIKLTEIFPPEFVNKIDEVIMFNPITREVARDILIKLIIEKSKKIFEKRGININFDSTFIDYILEIGYSPKFGVRNLERVFEKEVMTSVSKFIFQNTNVKNITVTADNGRINIY
ncbi:MAG TPA: tetratricopeptide repeat protein [Spirochaetota bacterium]|nr:tetratricopeptide repeat protein [Spirochaetota bacterium]HOL57465.1 tetratricopeptide repeat protein [Spirochaetota bacterium]HPP04076.1 tetratricopeptide repeat protein [Spirochaetota bacterium]